MIRRLTADDVDALRALSALFGRVFEDPESYDDAPPRDAYLRSLLGEETFIALVAEERDRVIGGLVAYELRKFEQERSEIYLYDLGVDAAYRRQGVATSLIERLREHAASRGAWVIFVQADTTPDDEPAIALYSALGTREEVLHFDIGVEVRRRA